MSRFLVKRIVGLSKRFYSFYTRWDPSENPKTNYLNWSVFSVFGGNSWSRIQVEVLLRCSNKRSTPSSMQRLFLQMHSIWIKSHRLGKHRSKRSASLNARFAAISDRPANHVLALRFHRHSAARSSRNILRRYYSSISSRSNT